MNCNNCDNPLEEGINLCPNCGKEFIICLNCGSHNEINSNTCVTCKSNINDYFEPRKKEKIVDFKEIVKKKKPVIYVVFASIILFLFCLLIIIRLIPEKEKLNILYISEGTLYSRISNKSSANKLTDVTDIPTTLMYNNTFNKAKISENGKRIFFPASLSNGYELKYSNVTYPENGTTIDEDVSSYIINKKGTIVYYTKGLRELYCSNLDKRTKVKIDEWIGIYYVNPEGSKAIYDKDDNIYLFKNNSKTTIAIDAQIIKVSKDLSKLYFIRNSQLYLLEEGKEEQLVVDKMLLADNIIIYDSGEIFYLDQSKLYYFFKNKSTVITENFDRIINLSNISPVMIINQINTEGSFVINKDNISKLTSIDGVNYTISNSGTHIYYMNETGTLFDYDIKKKSTTEFDKDIQDFSLLKDSDKLIYFKIEDRKADLYINKKKIDSNVEVSQYTGAILDGMIISDTEGNIVYIKQQLKDHELVKSLYLYNGKKTIQITDKYDQLYYISPEAIVYMTINEDSTYDIYLFNGKSSKLIQKNSIFVPITKENYNSSYNSSNEIGIHELYGYDVEIIFLRGLIVK